MQQKLILAINEMNTDFYKITNPYLNHSDHVYRLGWVDLINIIKETDQNLNVLDIACGDGRFGCLLAQNNLNIQSYIGVDNSKFSLEIASQKISNTSIKTSELIYSDLIFDIDYLSKISSETNIVVIIGLFHHLPSQKLRLEFMKKITDRLSSGARLIWTTFQYLDIPRLKRQVLDLQDPKITQFLQSKFDLDISELESGDSILEWSKILETKETIRAYRYSHYFNQNEIDDLINQSNLILKHDFTENGNEGGLNRYFICEKG